MNVSEQPNLFKKEYQKYRYYENRETDWSTLIDFSQSEEELLALGIKKVEVEGL